VEAIIGNQLGEPIDEADLEEDLERLQQEAVDEQMLKAGTVPSADAVNRLPSPAQQERKTNCPPPHEPMLIKYAAVSNRKQAVVDDEEAELEKLRAEMAM
jgi:charged multivesicular body protein 4A/B